MPVLPCVVLDIFVRLALTWGCLVCRFEHVSCSVPGSRFSADHWGNQGPTAGGNALTNGHVSHFSSHSETRSVFLVTLPCALVAVKLSVT